MRLQDLDGEGYLFISNVLHFLTCTRIKQAPRKFFGNIWK